MSKGELPDWLRETKATLDTQSSKAAREEAKQLGRLMKPFLEKVESWGAFEKEILGFLQKWKSLKIDETFSPVVDLLGYTTGIPYSHSVNNASDVVLIDSKGKEIFLHRGSYYGNRLDFWTASEGKKKALTTGFTSFTPPKGLTHTVDAQDIKTCLAQLQEVGGYKPSDLTIARKERLIFREYNVPGDSLTDGGADSTYSLAGRAIMTRSEILLEIHDSHILRIPLKELNSQKALKEKADSSLAKYLSSLPKD